jgi:NAD(P)-dependent dehydrogenase (short-subunit alcohol dehydrogenase family)
MPTDGHLPTDDLAGTTIIITGASSGIGRAAAKELAGRGASIGVVGRNAERTRAVAAEVDGQPFIADFDRLSDVRHIAQALLTAYPRIDVLANNAGGLVSTRGLTADGHERTFQHNHIAPFLLTTLLLPRLTESGSRVISTASAANAFGRFDLNDLEWARRRYAGGWQAYGTSKLETIMFIRELARRTADTGVQAFSFHPGFVATGFGANSALLKFGQFISRGNLGMSPEQGGGPLVHLASATDVGVPSGTYFDGLKPNGFTLAVAKNEAAARSLWEKSEQLVAG